MLWKFVFYTAAADGLFTSMPNIAISSSTFVMPPMPKFLDKDFRDIRRKERRERGTEVDVLHAEVEQSEENDDGLLLVPRDIVGNRKIVDVIQAEHLFELQCDQCERVGIVALAGNRVRAGCRRYRRDSS